MDGSTQQSIINFDYTMRQRSRLRSHDYYVNQERKRSKRYCFSCEVALSSYVYCDSIEFILNSYLVYLFTHKLTKSTHFFERNRNKLLVSRAFQECYHWFYTYNLLFSCSYYDDFVTIDWVRDRNRDRIRHKRLEVRRQLSWRGWGTKMWDALSGWLIVFLVGVSSGLLAGERKDFGIP